MPNVEQLTSFFLASATLLTATGTLYTVKEMARQRKASYRPDVVASRQYAYARSSEGIVDFKWVRNSANSSNHDAQRNDSRQYTISLFNVGIGVAKQVEATWALDLEPWIKTLNEIAQRSFTPILIVNEIGSGTVHISGPNYPTHVQMVANQLKQEWAYLLPAAIDQLGIELTVPSCFLQLAALQIAMTLKLAGEGGIKVSQWPVIPEATLSVRYYDAGAT